MAKSQPSGEPKAPLIVALAFFVLASLVLGVLFYMETDKKASAVAETKKANEEKNNADKLKKAEQDKVKMYRVALGLGEADDGAALASADPAAGEELNKVKAGIEGALKGLIAKQASLLVGQNKAIQLGPDNLLKWGSLATGKPDLTLADAVVQATAFRLLAEGKQATAEKSLADATKSFQDQAAAFDAAKKALDQQIETVKREAKEALDKREAELAAIRTKFGDATNAYTKSQTDMKEKLDASGIQLEESKKAGERLSGRLEQFEDKAAAAEDPFRNQKPLGKIVRRMRDGSNAVYIDLGWADNVPVGLKFTVQPANTPEVGIAGRLRPRVGPTGRPVLGADGLPSYDMVPKGKIEVVAVEGEHLSRCRITSEAEPTRDRIEYGDLLYNTSWRKGKTDTVVLYGLFDANGDGSDDVKSVIRSLQQMGITVAAYFDLDQKKWLDPVSGRPTAVTEQVVYAVEGQYPANQAGDTLAAARSELYNALETARKDAKDRGVKLVKARTYFPQIGFEYRGGDVTPDKINQAYNRYLRGGVPGEAPPPPAEGK